jgi:membrane protease YdiL (CAAX protease family)
MVSKPFSSIKINHSRIRQGYNHTNNGDTMKKFKDFALKRPFIFGLVLIVLYSILGFLTYPVHFLFPETDAGQLLGDGLGKLIIFLVFLVLYWRFGWLKDSGLSRFGTFLVWLVCIPLIVYKVLTWLYAFTGDLSLPISNWNMAWSILTLQLGTSLVEETMIRGLVISAMLIAWGNTKSGQIKTLILSSLYFGMIHLFNLIIRPPGVVLLQALILSLPGLLYAALVMKFNTLWPGIVMHWLTNAAVNIKLIGVGNYQETLPMWLTAAIVTLPLALLAIYWVWKLPTDPTLEDRRAAT